MASSSRVQKKLNNVLPQKVSQPAPGTISRKHVAKKTASPYIRKLKRYAKQGVKSLLLSKVFYTSFKVFIGILASATLLYASYSYIGKTFANEVVVSQGEIIARVGKLVVLPTENPYEIVRVQDGEDLKKQNEFYKDIQEGNYILMYKNMAVIYDLRNNVIVAVKRTGAK